MKKYTLRGLELEVTRECNKACIHCGRGEAQKIRMNKELIDRIFDEIADTNYVTFTGGEPLLEIALIEYVIDLIIENDWETTNLFLITNGTILDDRILMAFDKFCKSKKDRCANLEISKDRYHDMRESNAAYNYYTEKCATMKCSERLHIKFHRDESTSKQGVSNIGRAKRNALDNVVVFPEPLLHRLHVTDEIKIECLIEVCANGNVIPSTRMMDFETEDSLSIGNLMLEPFSTIIDRFQRKCLLSCKDVESLENDSLAVHCTDSNLADYYDVNLTLSTKVVCRIQAQINKQILHVRELAQKTYPNLPAKTIIERIPMILCVNGISELKEKIIEIYSQNAPLIYRMDMDFVLKNCDDLILNLYSCFRSENPNTSFTDYDLMLMKVHALLKSKQPLHPYHLFGSDAQIKQSSFFRLLEQQKQGE